MQNVIMRNSDGTRWAGVAQPDGEPSYVRHHSDVYEFDGWTEAAGTHVRLYVQRPGTSLNAAAGLVRRGWHEHPGRS